MTLSSESHAACRIIDANANRSQEGLRVVEDFARFGLNDSYLATEYKELRHQLAEVLAMLPSDELTASRDTLGDVGTEIEATCEYERANLYQVALASQKRVEQALRCIEEYSKTLQPDIARRVEQIRYRLYSVGKAICTVAASQSSLTDRRLYVLLDGCESEAAFSELACEICATGADIIQLRDKQLSDRELVARGRLLREITKETETLFIVNDRPDIAAIVRADGVHVGQDELAVNEARSIVGANCLVGVSTHSIEQARQAVLDGANYIGCGPTFPSRTKDFDKFPGLEFLEAVAKEFSLPAFAIGGITLDNLQEVLQVGIQRIAVGNCVTAAESPKDMIQRLATAICDADLLNNSSPNAIANP